MCIGGTNELGRFVTHEAANYNLQGRKESARFANGIFLSICGTSYVEFGGKSFRKRDSGRVWDRRVVPNDIGMVGWEKRGCLLRHRQQKQFRERLDKFLQSAEMKIILVLLLVLSS